MFISVSLNLPKLDTCIVPNQKFSSGKKDTCIMPNQKFCSGNTGLEKINPITRIVYISVFR